MTLGDLIKTGWIKDSDKLSITSYGTNTTGHWYEDNILKLTGEEIKFMLFTDDGNWTLVTRKENA